MRWSGASRSCRASNTWTSTPRTSRSACATTAPPEGPDRGMRDPPPATTAYPGGVNQLDRKSTRLNSSHVAISYAVFCLKKKKEKQDKKQIMHQRKTGS